MRVLALVVSASCGWRAPSSSAVAFPREAREGRVTEAARFSAHHELQGPLRFVQIADDRYQVTELRRVPRSITVTSSGMIIGDVSARDEEEEDVNPRRGCKDDDDDDGNGGDDDDDGNGGDDD